LNRSRGERMTTVTGRAQTAWRVSESLRHSSIVLRWAVTHRGGASMRARCVIANDPSLSPWQSS